jgi:tRNA(Phe) wybutosine-synthesizing methylase Tyw3
MANWLGGAEQASSTTRTLVELIREANVLLAEATAIIHTQAREIEAMKALLERGK